MPDHSGNKIWMKGQAGGEEQQAFAFYHYKATPWGRLELLSRQEPTCLRNPFLEKTVSDEQELGLEKVFPGGSV